MEIDKIIGNLLNPQDEHAVAEADKVITSKLGELGDQIVNAFYPAFYECKELSTDALASIKKLNDNFDLYYFPELRYELSSKEDVNAFFGQKLKRIFLSAYAINCPFCYGIISWNKKTNLIMGFPKKKNQSEELKKTILGLLPGVVINKYNLCTEWKEDSIFAGIATGIPEKNHSSGFDDNELSSLMRSLENNNYTLMFLCNPLPANNINEKIQNAFSLHDQCYEISKYTVGIQKGEASGTAQTNTETDSDFSAHTVSAGAKVLNYSYTRGSSHAKSVSETVSKTVSEGKILSHEIQNGWAIEFMGMLSSLAKRLKVGRNVGMWNMAVTFSSDKEDVRQILQSGIYGMLSSDNEANLQPFVYTAKVNMSEKAMPLLIPLKFLQNDSNLFGTLVTTNELSEICKIPTGKVIGLETRENKLFPLNCNCESGANMIGSICEYERPLEEVQFGFSISELNKHSFICGITGSGKTNTVKQILTSSNTPFMVIEPAKKEYRKINVENKVVYTLGRPELNCLQINPFYVMPGANLQQHIDVLKDLFCASFAFYGPMPFIMEKCLNNVYVKKGWNLTLGIHSYYIGKEQPDRMFDKNRLKEFYGNPVHKFLFPTMEDLKTEVDDFVKRLDYEGDVKGNIRSAINARIDSLCVGSKGFIFNTNEVPDFKELFEKKNVILELEGLADDADKAFSLGLLIILINEYRQISFEINNKKNLRHLLVIEEAHRLLKNVSASYNADLGNPKGKAVEHFTNMLAEMRSYGQGVVIAEQIPSKLAPDVIKNSSNKIIHRIVAKDDQNIIANTIGVKPDDILTLGQQKTGYALCHKEGMAEPVLVKIAEIKNEVTMDDEVLYKKNLDLKLKEINKLLLIHRFNEELKESAFRILIALMKKDNVELFKEKLNVVISKWISQIKRKLPTYIWAVDNDSICVKELLHSYIIRRVLHGGLTSEKIPKSEFNLLLKNTILNLTEENLVKCQNEFDRMYNGDARHHIIEEIAKLTYNYSEVLGQSNSAIDVFNYLKKYYLLEDDDDEFVLQVIDCLRGGN